MTADLVALADWLEAQGVRHVARESTGVHWKPVSHLLEGRFEVLSVKARHIRQVPGRETDVKDAEWIAQLPRCGSLKPSSLPPPPIRERRDLTRQRTQPVRERAGGVNRVRKVLEDADIRPAGVASDVLGVSGRATLEALIAGPEDPTRLAELARGSPRGQRPELAAAPRGLVGEHHRSPLRMLLGRIDRSDRWIGQFTERIEAVLPPFVEAAGRLETIPGVGSQAAEAIIAEIGADMARFPTPGHLASWAGMCPGSNRTGEKRRPAKTTEGSQWLRTALVQVARSASPTEETSLSRCYRRWAKRLGKKKALVASGHEILLLIHEPLKDQASYQERATRPQAA